MKTILLIHGPNLNQLGRRDTAQYGSSTLKDIERMVADEAKALDLSVRSFQSNHEGALIDWLQAESPKAAGIIVNAGALTHYSYALHDAIVDTGLPAVEVHLSDISKREDWRRLSVTAPACFAQIAGKKEKGYVEAVALLASKLKTQN